MGRGLSRLQKDIVRLLTAPPHRHYSTAVLVYFAGECGHIKPGVSKRQALLTVRRACQSLVNRGLIVRFPNPSAKGRLKQSIVWKIAPPSSATTNPSNPRGAVQPHPGG